MTDDGTREMRSFFVSTTAEQMMTNNYCGWSGYKCDISRKGHFGELLVFSHLFLQDQASCYKEVKAYYTGHQMNRGVSPSNISKSHGIYYVQFIHIVRFCSCVKSQPKDL